MSTCNNPMILVELTQLSYRLGTSIYAVDRVNGTLYGKCSVGHRVINERTTVEPQFRDASVKSMYIYSPHMQTLYQKQPVWLHLWPNIPH